MRQRTVIPITEEIIAEGMRSDAAYCVIAKAIRSVLPNATGIRVDLATIRWTDRERGLRYIYLTPIAAQQMIVDFDQGRDTSRLKPFQMRLRDVQIVKTRSQAERQQSRGIGTGNSPVNKARPRAITRAVVYRDKDSVAVITGGHRMPVADARSPERQRRYGARQLRP